MSDIKIHELKPKTKATQPAASLDEVLQEVQTWRANKPTPSSAIPDELWRKIFALEETCPGAKVRGLLSISTKQYNSKYQQFFSHISTKENPTSPQPTINLCQVKTAASKTAAYQPLKIPASNTIVAEFYRADGSIMKIHSTSESFSCLIKAFFEDIKNVADHVQA